MFNIYVNETGNVVLSGRFDASQVESATKVLNPIQKSVYVDFKDLDYISSAGLGILIMTQKRLAETGNSLTLINVNKMIRDIFHIARFDLIFKIE
jgi:anti-anti-sigma factor